MEQRFDPFEQLSGVDVDTPNIARMYDYFLGGAANFAVDRDAAEEFLQAFPGNTEWCWINRSFLGRAVTELCRLGIDQFLDLGSGVPTVGNVHEIASRHNPAARIAYVDNEPVACHHARHLLGHTSQVTVTQADITEPKTVLAAPGVAGLLDFTRPVAVLAVAILDILPLRDASDLVAAYRDACTSCSALVIANSARLDIDPDEAAGAEAVMERTTTPNVRWRSRQGVAELFAGYDLLEPGIVPSAQWRPEQPVPDEQAQRSNAYAAVGLLPPDVRAE